MSDGFCVCDDGRPAPDCGIRTHREQGRRERDSARPAAPEVCRCGHPADRHQPYVYEHQDACAGGTPGFCGCSGYIPAAPDTTGELREEILDVLYVVQRDRGIGMHSTGRSAIADAILALPALRALIAERDTAVAQVQAVEAQLVELEAWRELFVKSGLPMKASDLQVAVDRIRRALDGAATTGGGQ